ncbi:uncharacterized protein LOC135693754 [Rhopilema esculentum]|uniref:uncharacterized protein LOC135693754 n=1 Tax=Rhopilema esculentum TaxID=499914 RepID=UPI0031DC0E79
MDRKLSNIKSECRIYVSCYFRNSIASNERNFNSNEDKLPKKIKRLNEQLKKIESNEIFKKRKLSNPQFIATMRFLQEEKRENFLQKLHLLSIECHLQVMLKERYSTGQKQAVRLARQVNKQTRRRKNELAKY